MKKTLLAALLATIATPSFAVGPIDQVSSTFAQFPTYSAAIVGLVPAASATDFLTITGSATKTITVTRLECSGTSTAAGNAVVQLVLRSTADSAGTSTTPTAVALDSTQTAATAVVKAYTANPTTGTLTGSVRAGNLLTNVVATGAVAPVLSFQFGPEEAKGVYLRGATQVLALNGNGASFPSGSLINCHIEWVER